MSQKTTINYYNTNAKQFDETTAFVEFHRMQHKFLDKLPVASMILDFGCGSGRDTKYFIELVHPFCICQLENLKML